MNIDSPSLTQEKLSAFCLNCRGKCFSIRPYDLSMYSPKCTAWFCDDCGDELMDNAQTNALKEEHKEDCW